MAEFSKPSTQKNHVFINACIAASSSNCKWCALPTTHFQHKQSHVLIKHLMQYYLSWYLFYAIDMCPKTVFQLSKYHSYRKIKMLNQFKLYKLNKIQSIYQICQASLHNGIYQSLITPSCFEILSKTVCQLQLLLWQ